jgi:hypothetical protein
MHTTKIELSGYRATIGKKLPCVLLGTAGSKGNETLLVTRGTGWEGLTVKAVFHPQRIEVLVPESGEVDVPWEVTARPLRPEERGKIVFHGVDESTGRVLVTHDIAYKVSGHSPADGTAPGAPTPSVWEQWVADAGGVVDKAAAVVEREAAQCAQISTDAASAAASAAAAKQSAEAAAKIADIGVDTTLSTGGAAADAAAVGVQLSSIRDEVAHYTGSAIVIENLLPQSASDYTSGLFYVSNSGYLGTAESGAMSCLNGPISLKAGTSYSLRHVYPRFCFARQPDGLILENLGDLDGAVDTVYTPSVDCLLYISILTSEIPNAYVLNGPYEIDGSLKYGRLYSSITDPQYEIVVDANGSGDYTSVVEAVNVANSLQPYLSCPINISVYSGTYDLYEELGGDAWLATVTKANGERQGLYLRSHVNLYGVGRVIFTFYLDDTAELGYLCSGLNLWYSNEIKNIELYVKNCRYAVHDESNSANNHITRVIQNCKFVHLGCNAAIWNSPTCYGGGAGGGCSYSFLNSQFVANWRLAWSFHTGNNTMPSYFNVDGCVGVCAAEEAVSFRVGYYGTNSGKSIFHVKNCTGNGDVVKACETAGSVDSTRLFVNGYVKDPTLDYADFSALD